MGVYFVLYAFAGFFCIEERFAAVGLLVEEAENLKNKKQLIKLPAFISDCKTTAFSEHARAVLDQAKANPKEKLRLSLQMIDYIFSKSPNLKLQQYRVPLAKGLNLAAETNLMYLFNHYRHIYELYYWPVYLQAPYILPNYFANLFCGIFPLLPSQDMLQNYFTMAVSFTVLETFLVGLSAYYKETFSIQHIINVLQTFDHTRVSMKALPRNILEQAPDFSIYTFLSLIKPIG